MPITPAFLKILICPATRQRLHRLDDKGLQELNRRISAGHGKTLDGRHVRQPIEEGLVTEDRTRVYPVQEGIAVLLVEEAVALYPEEQATTRASNHASEVTARKPAEPQR
jgi:uncharacterized protein YbaR (Trm112 family)